MDYGQLLYVKRDNEWSALWLDQVQSKATSKLPPKFLGLLNTRAPRIPPSHVNMSLTQSLESL